jgi:hypothetical protein
MKKATLMAMVLLATVLCLAGPGWTQEKAAAPDVDGHVWMNSNSQEKKAFLLGAGSAFVLEYYIRTKHGEQPSRYVQGWVEVLKDQNWSTLEKALDQYYSDNPDKRNEHVFHVIWHQMIEPNLKD